MSNSKHTIIKLRRGTAAEWAASEPQPGGEVLKLGEPGYEKDTGKLKIGDGITPWNSLGYVAGGTILVEDIDHLISEVIQAGDGIQLNFDDANDTLTIAADNIVNSGDNRVLTSDGTSTGIEGEPALTFDGYRLRIDCDCPTGTAGLTVVGDQRSTSIVSNVYGDPRSIETEDGISTQRDTSRIILSGSRGTEVSPSGLEVGDVIFIIRGDAYNPYGTLNAIGNPENRSVRIQGRVSNSGTSYLGSSLEFQTTGGSGSGIWDNSMLFDHTGSLKINTVPVSLSGHTHQYSDITDFNDGVESVVDTLLVAGTGISLSYDGGTNSLTISSTGSGGGASTIAAVDWTANHTLVDGTRYLVNDVVHSSGNIYRAQFENESIPVTDGVYWESLGAGYRLNIDGRDIANIPYPVTDIVAGTNIVVTSEDGIYTIATSGSGGGTTIANYGDNRILTSDGTSAGINGESNLTFDGSLLSVSGNLVAVTGTYNQVVFNTSLADPNLSQGQLQWNKSEGTLDLGFTNTYSQHIGEELHYRVRNNTASTLVKGTAVYASGLTPGGNNKIEVAPFTADGSVREVRFMGLVTENISNGVNGYTTQFGYIRGIDTRGDAASNGYAGKLWDVGEPSWSEGDILYAHPTVAGKLTKVEPKHNISVAIVLNRHANDGKIFVRPTSYGHLDDNHDVAVSGATNGQFLQYNSVTDYWVPSSSGNFTILNVDNLRLDGNTLSSTNSDGNIVLAPNGTGDVQVDADTLRVGDSNAVATITTNGTGNLVLNTNTGTNSGSITIAQGSNGNITIAPNGSGDVYVDADTLRVGDSNSAATITTNGTGNLTLSTNSGTNSGTIVINQGSSGNISITPNGTGEVDLSKVDIDGGSIDGTAIGASSASTGKFTQLYPTVVSNGSVSGSVTTNVSIGQIFDMTVTGSTTLSNPTNSIDGVTVRWRIRQDGTGGHSVALGSDFQIPSSASSPLPWSTAANAMDILAATYHAGRAKWDVVAFVPGY